MNLGIDFARVCSRLFVASTCLSSTFVYTGCGHQQQERGESGQHVQDRPSDLRIYDGRPQQPLENGEEELAHKPNHEFQHLRSAAIRFSESSPRTLALANNVPDEAALRERDVANLLARSRRITKREFLKISVPALCTMYGSGRTSTGEEFIWRLNPGGSGMIEFSSGPEFILLITGEIRGSRGR